MSRALFALPAACLLVVPAKAQTQNARQSPGVPISSPFSTAIDPALVGQWELSNVERLGEIEDFGAVVDEMACEFSVDGEAHVTLAVEQDRDTIDRERSFRFVTAESRIVADHGPAVAYEILAEDEIRLTTADGLVVRMHRVEG